MTNRPTNRRTRGLILGKIHIRIKENDLLLEGDKGDNPIVGEEDCLQNDADDCQENDENHGDQDVEVVEEDLPGLVLLDLCLKLLLLSRLLVFLVFIL